MKKSIYTILIIISISTNFNIFSDKSISEAPIFENSNIESFPNLEFTETKKVKNAPKETDSLNKKVLSFKDKKARQEKVNICQPYCYDTDEVGNIQSSYPSNFPFEVENISQCNYQSASENNVCPKQQSYIDPAKFEFKEGVEALSDNLDIKLKPIYFLTWTAKIKNIEDLKENSIKILKILNKHPSLKVLVIGDAAKSITQYMDLYILSQRRADAIKSFLISQGVPPQKIIATGIGIQTNLSKPEEGNEAQNQDRKADIYIAIV